MTMIIEEVNKRLVDIDQEQNRIMREREQLFGYRQALVDIDKEKQDKTEKKK